VLRIATDCPRGLPSHRASVSEIQSSKLYPIRLHQISITERSINVFEDWLECLNNHFDNGPVAIGENSKSEKTNFPPGFSVRFI
jgi:hypothetical protein